MTNMKKRIAAALTSATLTIGLTIPTMAAETSGEPIRVKILINLANKERLKKAGGGFPTE